jgi:hypothetical protein
MSCLDRNPFVLMTWSRISKNEEQISLLFCHSENLGRVPWDLGGFLLAFHE